MIGLMSATTPAAPFLHAVRIGPRRLDELERDYTDELPAFAGGDRIELDPRVTFLVGENGSGKSTLVEAMAVGLEAQSEGGGRTYQFSFATRASHSGLHRRSSSSARRSPAQCVLPPRRERLQPRDGRRGVGDGGRLPAPAARAVARRVVPRHRGEPPRRRGLYFLDEPEAALSVNGQLALMRRMHELVRGAFAVRRRNALADPHGLSGRDDPRARRRRIGPVAYEETSRWSSRGRFSRTASGSSGISSQPEPAIRFQPGCSRCTARSEPTTAT